MNAFFIADETSCETEVTCEVRASHCVSEAHMHTHMRCLFSRRSVSFLVTDSSCSKGNVASSGGPWDVEFHFRRPCYFKFAVSGTGHRQDLAKIAEHAPHTEKAIFPTKDANWVATCVEYRPV